MIGLPDRDRRRPRGDPRPDAAAARADDEATRKPRGTVGRIIGSVNPLIPKPGTAYQWLPMEIGRQRRSEDQAAARADGRHRQRLLQHQVGAALVLPGAAVARRSPRRAGHRRRRTQRPELARGGRRDGRRRRLLHLPRPQPGRRAALGHHRRRHEGVVLSHASTRRASARNGRCRPSVPQENAKLLPVIS